MLCSKQHGDQTPASARQGSHGRRLFPRRAYGAQPALLCNLPNAGLACDPATGEVISCKPGQVRLATRTWRGRTAKALSVSREGWAGRAQLPPCVQLCVPRVRRLWTARCMGPSCRPAPPCPTALRCWGSAAAPKAHASHTLLAAAFSPPGAGGDPGEGPRLQALHPP